MGASVSPELEQVVFHALAKDKEKRTPSVEQMVAELRDVIYASSVGARTSPNIVGPASTLNIRTEPNAVVFVDNVPVGQT